MNPSEFKISFLVESYDEKTAENDRNWLRCRKAHGFDNIKDIDPKF